ncbi:MAG TPA: HAMP domain-containing sensor histidine kinase [Thermoanaerobaculia bacterium]|nr:HAMP domain-containing sensor histidine kinase [Thermoanaerobaculia bacterium]HQN07173.1 HAMP domain-containing sensor histidine kinase [Thermoanaerobaculia bacterium]HQP87367.1 HAMP domain-containing sensor histidine kinase [Thermoanaerobaculia bacterium]
MIVRSFARRTVAATLLTAAVSSLVFAVASVLALRLLWDRHDAVELSRTADAASRIFVLEQTEGEHDAQESAREALAQALEPADWGRFHRGRLLLAERGTPPAREEDGRPPSGWIETRAALAGGIVLEVARRPEEGLPLRRLFWAALLVAAIPSSLVALAVGRRAGRAAARPIEDLARRLGVIQHPRDYVPAPLDALPKEAAALEGSFASVLGRLEAALEREASFVRNAAHELRTPLTRIRLRAERAAAGASGACRLELQAVTNEVDRLTRLVDALLVLARDESSGLDLKETANLADVVRASAESGERTVAVDAPDEALVRGDEELLRLAVDNLLDNARKYAPADRVPRAVLTAAADGVTLSVETPGVSLPEEEREQVFERFYRGASARETAPGHGLGLSLARHVARVHGGDVVAAEPGADRTVFELRLPGWKGTGS